MSRSAGPGIGDAEVRRVLEGLRQRFAQLAESTLQLREVIGSAAVLPERNALLASYTVVATHQQAVTEQLARHHDLLMALDVFPLPAYPGQTQEEVLLQLLRKKPEPRVEDWMAGARELFLAHTRCDGGGGGGGNGGGEDGKPAVVVGNPESRMTEADWTGLWAWAPGVVKEEMARFRERTAGLDGEDEEGEDDGDEEDDDEEDEEFDDVMEITDSTAAPTTTTTESKPKPAEQPVREKVVQPISLSRMLKYYHTGTMPPPPETKPNR